MLGCPKILLVDDDELVLRALEKTLEAPDLEVLTASNGSEALELLRHHEIAVIICDQRMPQMSGSEVLKEAVRLQKHPIRTPLAASGDLNTVVKAINVGQASQFIMKPWDETALC